MTPTQDRALVASPGDFRETVSPHFLTRIQCVAPTQITATSGSLPTRSPQRSTQVYYKEGNKSVDIKLRKYG